MSWRDRGYNQGGEEINGYFANPAALLQMSLPLYKAPGFYIRLHFWFLLYALFDAVHILRDHLPVWLIPAHIVLALLAVLLHEAGHSFFAQRVGGSHWEWIVWPLGGMSPPHVSSAPWPSFVANIGGIAISLPLFLLSLLLLHFLPSTGYSIALGFSPMAPLEVGAASSNPAFNVLALCIAYFATINAAITIINLFPCYWFDGGRLWQAVLTPKFGAWKASTITAIAGMILAVPFFFISMYFTDFFGVIVWVLIFSDNFNRRRALHAAGPGVMDDADDNLYNYMDTPAPRRKKLKKNALLAARKRHQAEQLEQARIDAILEKVHAHGLHSLTYWEKRTLKKATERQRQRDLANRP